MSQSQGFYSEEEAQRILSIAARDLSVNGMTREELVRAAGEMGITSESIERAEAEIQEELEAKRKQQEEKELRAQFGRYMIGKVMASVGGMLTGAAFFVGIWYLSGGGDFWPSWMLFFMALGIVSELADVIFDSNRKERRYRKWLAKRDTSREFEGMDNDLAAQQEPGYAGFRISCRASKIQRRAARHFERAEGRAERERWRSF